MELRLTQKKGCVAWGLFCVILALLGIVILILDPVTLIVKNMLTLKEGSMAHELWRTVPVEIYLNAYIFNVTNSEAFITGKDKKISMEEIGPYVFLEKRSNYNITYNENGTMSYVPNLTSSLILEKSVGDPKVDRIIVPNIPLLGVLTMVANQPKWKQYAVRSILWSLDVKPFLNITVDEFMWGYDDKMVRLLSGYLPNWIDFEKFGILDRVYADKKNIATIELNETRDELYSIQYWGGSQGLKQWGFNDLNTSLPCNTLKGSYEGLLFPPNLKELKTIKLYKNIFCRPIYATYNRTEMLDIGLSGYVYTVLDDQLKCSNPDNVCYCSNKTTCLPDGLSDLTPCYYGLPVALSFPHFMAGDESLFERIDGMRPDRNKHTSFVTIQPNIGMPIKISTKTQLNLVLNDVSFMHKMKAFKNLIIPVLWMDGYVAGLPDDLTLKMKLAFIYMPIVQQVVAWSLLIIAAILFIYKSVYYILAPVKSKEKTHNSLKYIAVSISDNGSKGEVKHHIVQ